MMRDRGASLEDEHKLPRDLMEARAAAGADAGQADTEPLRKAMLHYERIFEDAVGKAMTKRTEDGRREVAG